MRLLSDLLSDFPVPTNVEGNVHVQISDITTDSRHVRASSLFVALRGVDVDGHQFISQALANGAVAVMMARDTAIELEAGLPVITVEDTREALAYLAADFYGAQPEHIVAVTGTDGKTSTAEFTRQLWKLLGHKAASIGTLGLTCDDEKLCAAFPATHTSPDPMALHAVLAGLCDAHVSHVAMEASSHGLDQHRLDAVKLCAAAFTNFTRDHLDYHQTIEAYFTAKARLFSEVLPEGMTAVLNADDARYAQLCGICESRSQRVISYGRKGETLKIAAVEPHALGLSARVDIHGKTLTLALPMYGEFQLYNMLAAVGLVSTTHGASLEEIMPYCEKLAGVAGRMELVARHPSGAAVFIDYAHTPAALQKLLEVARQHITGKLLVVFGCGGNRDTGKRPQMGAVAQSLSDIAIVTDDNPRNENPAAIRAAIMAACPNAIEMGNRAEAIAFGLSKLDKNDALIVAGKGHETTQIIGEQILHFNDAEVIREALARL